MKKILSTVLLIALCLSLCGCAAERAAEPAAETRIITDALGREVEIPAVIERIVPLGNAPRMCTYLGLQERFVTVTQSEISENPLMAYGWYNQDGWKDMPIGASGGYGVIHPEVILEAEPDLIICTYEPEIVEDIVRQTGLPVIAVAQGELFGEDYDQALRIIAEACGVEARAEELIGFIHGCLEDLEARCAGQTSPEALAAAATFRGGHGIGGVYVKYSLFDVIGANDVTDELDRGSWGHGLEVDLEQVMSWDPEYIFLDAGNVGLVQAEIEQMPDYFAQLSAFKSGKVYQCPNSTNNYSNVEIPLTSAYYIGSVLYPEAFADVDFEAKAEEIFSMFLGHEGFLSVLREHGYDYRNLDFGELNG